MVSFLIPFLRALRPVRRSVPGVRDPFAVGTCHVPVTLVACGLLVSTMAATSPAAAQQQAPEDLRQQAQQILGRDLSDQEFIDMLRQSGMTSQQIRDRLR